jgi:hypothetical protein
VESLIKTTIANSHLKGETLCSNLIKTMAKKKQRVFQHIMEDESYDIIKNKFKTLGNPWLLNLIMV